VASGIEALAAVLPAGRNNTVTEGITKQVSPPVASPPALEEPAAVPDSSTEDEDSPRDYEPFIMDDMETVDPILVDGLGETGSLSQDEFTFDPFEDYDLDSASFDDLGLDFDDVSYKNNFPSTSAPSMLTARVISFFTSGFLPSPKSIAKPLFVR
jgi:hypothetical protein